LIIIAFAIYGYLLCIFYATNYGIFFDTAKFFSVFFCKYHKKIMEESKKIINFAYII